MDHGTLQQLAAGAALGDLDAAERIEFDAHLATCPTCAALTTDLDDVLAELALAAPDLRPPASLRREVLSALREQPIAGPIDALDAVQPAPPVALPIGRRAATWAALGMAAALAVVAVGLGARTLDLEQQQATAAVALEQARSALTARNAALALMAAPDSVVASLHAEPVAPAATAMVVFRPGSVEAYLMAVGLPATDADHVYQLWVADAAGVHALGTFQHDGTGPFVVPFGVDLGDSAAAMVTLELDGGSAGEPGPQVVFGEL